ncbi:hypothetical protein [Limisalsivibrio acetivorans]|uniref:hypothetical protein n=1 Tax=Limisalsivibrio acetivorans TaxID=1304888 RepID=UPI0003B78FBC|nr:hypothetical protein [Limisalsivibrio acetivorans]
MTDFSVAVFANDSLLLGEVLDKLEDEFPLFRYTVYSMPEYLPLIASDRPEISAKSIDELSDEDIMVVLSDPGSAKKTIAKLDASIVDFTGIFDGDDDDVYIIREPLQYVAYHVKGDRRSAFMSVSLPAAAFGKNGIDDLLSQTRELFSFTQHKSKVFDERLAFNVIVDPGQGKGLLSGYVKSMSERTGMYVDARILPVSTIFMADLVTVGESYFEPGEDFYQFKGESIAEAAESEGIGMIKTAEGKVTLIGDYIKVVAVQAAAGVKEATGV